MKFGKVENPDAVDFTLPTAALETKKLLKKHKKLQLKNIRIGCAKWNRKDLKGFYPRGTGDELKYYSSQFNAIELNASFYRMFPAEQFITWRKKTEKDFMFFPKVPRYISHIKRLQNCEPQVNIFTKNILALGKKLGMPFLQLPENFQPKNMDRLELFFKLWPGEIPLAAEFRNTNWFTDKIVNQELISLLQEYKITNIIVDSAGRRDLLHMQLTTPTAFIRYNGANHPSDYTRLDEWLIQIEEWYNLGLKNVYFFVHQNVEKASPLLSAYFIKEFNKKFNTSISIPQVWIQSKEEEGKL